MYRPLGSSGRVKLDFLTLHISRILSEAASVLSMYVQIGVSSGGEIPFSENQ